MFDGKDLMVEIDLEFPDIVDEDPIDNNGISILEQPFTDVLVHAKVLLPHDSEMQSAKVIGSSRSDSGGSTDTYYKDPFLNLILYDLEFPDSVVKQYAANNIADNMFLQVTYDGHTQLVLDMILVWKTDESTISKDNMWIITRIGTERIRRTTKG